MTSEGCKSAGWTSYSAEITLEYRIERCCGLRRRQLYADRAKEIGIGRLQGPIAGISENRIPELMDNRGNVHVQQFGDMIGIDMAAFVEYDRQRISRTGNDRRHRWSDHTGSEYRTRLRGVGLQIVILDRGHQPAIWIVAEGGESRPMMGFSDLTGLRVLLDRHRRMVDWPEVADEAGLGDAKPDLNVAPETISFLGR
jgi:hypothetical protein